MKRLVSLLAGLLAASTLSAQNSAAVPLQKLLQVYKYVEAMYVDEVGMEPLVREAIVGMLGELDPHSAYLSAEEMEDVDVVFDGSFGGIGVEFNVLRDTIIVVNTVAGGPSERVGILPNDRIVAIDTLSAIGMKRNDVPKHLRGGVGSRVEVGVVRHGVKEPLRFSVVREKIPLHAVDAAYTTPEGFGYIRVNRFGRTTMSEFREAYAAMGRPQEIIVDLRGNSGGLIDQAVEMASLFLPEGATVVSTEGRAVKESIYRAKEDGQNLRGHLVVLIDERSASASEIVAGAMQDWDRGVVIGRRSFGKGLVQRQVRLPDGDALRLTIARYHTPSGRVIQRPYERGKREEYYNSHMHGGDDSLDMRSPAYTTLRSGRLVYGGGGIHPDMVVEADTAGFSDYYAELIRRGVVGEFVIAALDRHRAEWDGLYPDFQSFERDFEVDGTLLDGLVALGVERGVREDAEGLEQARERIALQLKALFAQRLFDSTAYWRLVNSGRDAEFRRACEVLASWRSLGAPLLDGKR